MSFKSVRPFALLCLAVCYPFSFVYAKSSLKVARALQKSTQTTLRLSVKPVDVSFARLSVTGYQHQVSSASLGFTSAGHMTRLTSSIERAIFRQSILTPVAPVIKTSFPDLQAIDAVIFDLDGTILDSLSAWEHSGTNYLRSQGIIPEDWLDEELAKMSLLDGANLVKEMYDLPQEPEEILRRTLAPIYERYATDLPLKPGVVGLLFHLKARGIKLCIATASDRVLAETALERLGVLNLFDFIVTCDEVGVGKRSAAVYEQALIQLGTSKPRTLVVEDAPYALQTAQRAGFPTLGVYDPKHGVEAAKQLSQQADYYLISFPQIFFR